MSEASIWEAGVQGPPGPPGPSILLRQTDTYIQWSVEGTGIWFDLISIAAITGPQGDSVIGPQGPPGPQGEKGDTVVGPPGPQGIPGTAATIIAGTGTPNSLQGNATDLYINVLNGDLWGPKTVSGWPSTPAMNIKGPTGAPGASPVWGNITGTLSAQTDLQSALDAKSGFGVGQTYQDVTGSRLLGTTYPNATGKPITIIVSTSSGSATNTINANIGGAGSFRVGSVSAGTGPTLCTASIPIPVGASQVITSTGTLVAWIEVK